MATHSSVLAWRILWMEEPGRLESKGSQRVGHNWATSLSFFLKTLWNYLKFKFNWDAWFLAGSTTCVLSSSAGIIFFPSSQTFPIKPKGGEEEEEVGGTESTLYKLSQLLYKVVRGWGWATVRGSPFTWTCDSPEDKECTSDQRALTLESGKERKVPRLSNSLPKRNYFSLKDICSNLLF